MYIDRYGKNHRTDVDVVAVVQSLVEGVEAPTDLKDQLLEGRSFQPTSSAMRKATFRGTVQPS